MSEVTGTSRRAFIGTAGAAVAVAGVATAIPGFASTGASATPLEQKVVVTVVDPAKGVFNVLWGEKEVEITDKAFAGKLASVIA